MKRIAKAFLCLLLAGVMSISLFPAGVRAEAGEAVRVSLSLTVPNAKANRAELLTDDRADTYLELGGGDIVTARFENAAHLVIRWHALPEKATIAFLSDKTVLQELSADTAFYNVVLPVPAGANAVRIEAHRSKRAELSDLIAYSEGDLPASVQVWEKPDKADVLIVVPFGGDEYRYFGGLIPTLIQDGVSFNICYLGNYSRLRVEEVLSVRWAMGLHTYPVFISCDKHHTFDYSALKKQWDERAAQKALSEAFDALDVKILVTCSASEENEAAARLTNEYVLAAVKTDKGKHIKKLYVHDPAGKTALTYAECIPTLDGVPADVAAQNALNAFGTLRIYHGKVSDVMTFTLASTRVGEDKSCDSLLEHLNLETHPLATLSPSPEPTATPTPTPTATPEPTFTPEPTATAVPGLSFSETPVITPEPTLVPTAEPAPTEAPKKGLFSCGAKTVETSAPTVAPTDTPSPTDAVSETRVADAVAGETPTPTPAPMPTATPEPTEAPTPTPVPTETPRPTPAAKSYDDGWDEYFLLPEDNGDEGFAGDRAEGMWEYRSPEEYILSDEVRGHWEYRSDELSVLIDRTETQIADGPLVYYTAHVRMRSDQYRSAFGHEGRSGRTTIDAAPWKVARRYRAVLLITGDNLLNMDTDKKGVLMRDGRVYQNTPKKKEMLSWDPVSLTLGIHEKGTMSSLEFQERGVTDVHSFGPWLIHNGERNTEKAMRATGLFKQNPRTGVGMVEPGHLVMIVVDGRQDDRSIGLNLMDFTALFEREGCKEAYNLDGGVSAAMVFMGEQLNTHLDIKDKSQQRNLPDALTWGYTRVCPTLDDPIYHDGIRKGGKLTLRG